MGSDVSSTEQQASVGGWTLAVLGPIAVGAVLVPLRDELVSTNLALILVVVVVLAAIAGGRGPGAVAAVIAALSYDFFLTRPYLSLTIDSADDVETTIILLAIGLIVGQLVTITRRSRTAASRGADEVARLHRVAEQAAGGASLADLVAAVEAELTGLLALERCTFERPPHGPPLPRLERGGAVVGGARHVVGGEFVLPADGVELPVLGRGTQYGRLVLVPKAGHGVSLEERVVAVALSDQLGAALAVPGKPAVAQE
jgi:hypothetical protein